MDVGVVKLLSELGFLGLGGFLGFCCCSCLGDCAGACVEGAGMGFMIVMVIRGLVRSES